MARTSIDNSGNGSVKPKKGLDAVSPYTANDLYGQTGSVKQAVSPYTANNLYAQTGPVMQQIAPAGSAAAVPKPFAGQYSTGGAPGAAQGGPKTYPGGGGANNTEPMTGFSAAHGYTPEGIGLVYKNPGILANDVLGGMGINSPSMSAMMGSEFAPLEAAQFILNGGRSNADEHNLTDNSTMNFIANAMQQMNTPGGRFTSADALMQAMMGSGAAGGGIGVQAPSANDSRMGAPLGAGANGGVGPNSPLAAYLNYNQQTGMAYTPDQQVAIFNSMAGHALNQMNPFAQQAFKAALGQQGQQYVGNAAHGNPGAPDYASYLQGSQVAPWFR